MRSSLLFLFTAYLACPAIVVEGATKSCRCLCSPSESSVFITINDTEDLRTSSTAKTPTTTQAPVPVPVFIVTQAVATTTTTTTTTASTTARAPIPVPVFIVTEPTITTRKVFPSDSSFDLCQQDFQKASLDTHNQYRYLHHVGRLVSDTKLQSIALKYAQLMAVTDVFEHSGTEGLGENLAYVWSSRVTSLSDCAGYGQRFTKMWYDEVSLYNFDNPGFYHETGHFTQLVWRDTTNVGCGLAISKDSKIYGVCNYSPPGNYIGAKNFRDNVLRK